MSLSYRFAEEADLEWIFKTEQESMSCPWSLKSYQEALASEHSVIAIAEQDGLPAGFVVLYLTPPEAELPDIVTSKEFRGQGVGRFLLEQSVELLKARGIDTLFLEVRVSNEVARSLYERIGFEQIGVRKYFYSDPVEDAVCMSLRLDTNQEN